VLVTVFDRERMADYMKVAAQLREAGIRTELFLGTGGIGKQMKYADKLEILLVVIAGSDEFERGTFQIKDLALGREMSKDVTDRKEWREDRPAQFEVPAAELVTAVKSTLAKATGRQV
jgi:histidyl-tRNA synthetase